MDKYLQPTVKGRLALLVVVLYCLAWALLPSWTYQSWLAGDDTLAAVDALLYLALFQTLISVLPAVLMAWLFVRSIRAGWWPNLGGYVPFRVKIREIKHPWLYCFVLPLLSLFPLVFPVAAAWFDYFRIRQFLA